jgi:zinc transport system permease protein
MIPEFMLYALLAGAGVALVAGPLGSFVVWRRMAYFGDTLAHSALLGVAIGVLLEVHPLLAVIVSSLVLAVILVGLQTQKLLADDTLLGILSHSTLALGLVCAGLLADTRIDLWGLLFGDLLTTNRTDLLIIYAAAGLVLVALWSCWRPLIFATLDETLAQVEGIPVVRLRLLLMGLIALVVALALKVVGVLLITSLLIIPAATSRRFSRSPEAMAMGASLLGVAAVSGGLGISYFMDTPAGPSIVLAASSFFAVSLALPRRI